MIITGTSKENAAKISVVCGNNCKIIIRGISVLNSGLFIFMNDGATLDMGSGQLFNGHFKLMMHEPSKISVGNGCLWGSGEFLTSDCHSILDSETRKRINPPKDISIGDRVWFGAGVKILKGANISSDTVVSSCAVVTSGDYPGNTILAGIPAKVVKSGIVWDPHLL